MVHGENKAERMQGSVGVLTSVTGQSSPRGMDEEGGVSRSGRESGPGTGNSSAEPWGGNSPGVWKEQQGSVWLGQSK